MKEIQRLYGGRWFAEGRKEQVCGMKLSESDPST
jgi:hypothetical protein